MAAALFLPAVALASSPRLDGALEPAPMHAGAQGQQPWDAHVADQQHGSANSLGPRVWATLLTGVTLNVTLQIEHQMISVRRHSAYPHVTLVTPEVPASARERVRLAGSHLINVTRIESSAPAQDPWFADIFTKLHIFNFTQFSQIAYVDSDALLIDRRADGIFDECARQGDPPFCGVRDLHNTTSGGVMLNAGVVVVRPSAEDFEGIANRMRTTLLGRFGEQELLADHFASRMGYLPVEFNSCNPRAHVDSSYIMHVCGDQKINELPLCVWDTDAHRTPGRMCASRALTLAQSMLVEAHPCVYHNHDRTGFACAAAAGCGWCGFETGCTASDQCFADSETTRALIARQRTAPRNNWGKWSVLKEAEPHTFGDVLPDYWSTLVTITVVSCNRLPFLQLILDRIDDNRQPANNPDNFGVPLEVLIVDDSPEDSHTGRALVGELYARYPRLQVMGEHDIPEWQYDNRTIALRNGEVLPHASTTTEVSRYHNGNRPMVVRLLRLRERATIGAKRTFAAKAARGHIIQQWDDDDLLPPQAIWQHMLPILHGVADVVTFAFDWYFIVPTGQFYRQHPDTCVGGLGAMAYLRSVVAEVDGFSRAHSLSEDLDFIERALMRCHRFLIHDCYDRDRSGYVYTRHGALSGRYGDTARNATWEHGYGPVDAWPWFVNESTAQDSTWSVAGTDSLPTWMKAAEAYKPPEWLSEEVRWNLARAENETTRDTSTCTAPNHSALAQPEGAIASTERTFPRMPRSCCAPSLESNIDDGCWTNQLQKTWDMGFSGFGHYAHLSPTGFK